MRISNEQCRAGLAGLVLWLCLVLPGMAVAQGTTEGRAGAVQDFVEALDARAGTIVLGAETFAVGARARLLDVGGRPIGLSQLNAKSPAGEGDRVEYIATQKRSGGYRVIRQLQVVEGEFE